jgi:TrmH family RNA methyltransferase
VPVITSPGNAAVKAARKLARPRAGGRDARGLLVEGPAGVREALPWLERLFVAAEGAWEHGDVVDAARAAGVPVAAVTDAVLASITDTVTPQGLVGVARLPAADLSALDGARFIVVLGQVRDPGNAGTAVRTADATGADAVVLTRGSVDVANPKTVRAAAGSLFHLPVVTDVATGDLVATCRARGLRLVGAAADGDAVYSSLDLTVPTAFAFGNEAWGLDDDLRGACDVVARVPLHTVARPGYAGVAESLNLAATVAIVAAEAARQRGAR